MTIHGHINLIVSAVLLAAAVIISGPARAEPAVDRILSGAQISDGAGCAQLRIDFNIRIRYISHFPIDRGDQISIRFSPIDFAEAEQALLTNHEAVPPPADKIAGIRSIEFNANGAPAPELVITFRHPVTFRVAAGGDFQSLAIAIAGPGATPCAPIVASSGSAQGGWRASVLSETLPPAATDVGQPPSEGKLSTTERAAVTALMDRAREALGAGAADAAVKALTRVLGYPKSEVTQEATELLGLAHQRRGDIEEARTIYKEYIARYPGGDDAKRVADRLASLDKPAPQSARKVGSRETHFGEPGQPSYIVTGSFSQFYMRDQGVHNFVDPSLPPPINQPADANQVFQNDVLSSFDLQALWGNAGYQGRFRFSGALDDGLSTGASQTVSIADLEFDAAIKAWGLTTKLGRQTLNTDGVLGRFDGGLVSWQALPGIRLDTVVGSPVALRADAPYKDGTVFYGEGVDFSSLFGPFDTNLHVLQQQTGGFIDRQVAGVETRYADETKSLFLSLDYDTHFDRLDSAIANGSWTLADKSTFTLSAEDRSSPGLDTRNALIGQTATSLTDLLAFYSKDEITQLAKDRTAYADSASVGFSRPIDPHLQLSADASWFDLTATPASGGVDANPDSGAEYYLSAQLIGNDLLKPSDLYILGLRYASTSDSKAYVTDISARYPITDQLRINPRLRLGYRNGDSNGAGWEEYTLLPSLKVDYQWTRNFGLELESGAKFTERLQSGTRDDETEYFITAGYRYDFNAEGPVAKTGP